MAAHRLAEHPLSDPVPASDSRDPFRWLEDPGSAETQEWVRAQNQAARSHLDALESRPWFLRTLQSVVCRPRAGTPRRLGGRYVVSRNDGTQQQDLWFVADTLEELVSGGRLLIDPNTLSDDGTSSLAGSTASRDGRYLAYQVSDGGSDETSVRLLEPASGRLVDDVVSGVRFSEATWLPDHGSYLYLHFRTGDRLEGGRLMRHYVGESQETDELVLELPEEPRLFITPELTHDGRWLVLHLHEGTSEKNRLWVCPVSTESGAATIGEPVRVVDEAYAGFHLVRGQGTGLLLLTDHDAPLRRVVRLDLETSATVDVVPEQEHLLEHVEAAGDELVAVHLVDARPRVTRHSLDGSPLGAVDVDGGALVALHGEVGHDDVFLGLSSVTRPVTAYHLRLGPTSTADLRELDLAPVGDSSWQPPRVRTERRRATSPDGTRVPYFLVRPTDDPADDPADDPGDRPRPTLLWGYGGFGVPVLASYREVFVGWLAAGGVLVLANLRGGGEFGSAWHDAGRLRRKQNVFDDFAAVGDHLVAEGVTTHAQLALHGRSNGGLLVAATVNQRPDLAAVSLPGVGVLDMLRFHLFTIGAAWVPDYGSPDDPEMAEVLGAYSPLHNLVDGTAYPATLVVTGDHDDRVVPAHSFKYAAALQRAQGGDAPVLVRIETSTGHGAGKPVSAVVQEAADLLAFAAEHTGLR